MFGLNILRGLMNKWVIIGIIVLGALTYHYFTVTGLEKDVAILETNYTKLDKVNSNNVKTIKKLRDEVNTTKEKEKVKVNSYITEITKLKSIIKQLNNKPEIIKTEKILVKDCSIKIKHLKDLKKENKDENTIIWNLSNIGN
jgi:hypothetical protein